MVELSVSVIVLYWTMNTDNMGGYMLAIILMELSAEFYKVPLKIGINMQLPAWI